MRDEVYIRCDGSSVTGLGHIVRCVALAHMLKNTFHVTFFCKEIPPALEREVTVAGLGLRKLKLEDDFFPSLTRTAIVVLDGYQFDAGYQKKIRQTNAQLVVIDDLHEDEFFADLIINQVPGITAASYQAQPYTHFALGPEYALLRKPFLQAASRDRSDTQIASILICFGGADPENFTKRALRVAMYRSEFKKITVIVGQAYSNVNELMALAKSDERVFIHQGLNATEMADQFRQAQVSIVPSSGILLEAIATHSTIISGYYVDNQRLVYEAYKNSFTDAGNFSENEIVGALDIVLQKPGPAKIKLDGLSGERLLKRFKQLAEVKHITIQKAEMNNLDLTFKWASNPAVRAFSFQRNEIRREEHEAWFQKKLGDISCVYFLGYWKTEPIGSVRFDIQNNQALISYLIDPAYHSKGFGLILLTQSFQPFLIEARKRGFRVAEIVGYVMKDNYPSRKTFVNLGFYELEEDRKLRYSKPVKE